MLDVQEITVLLRKALGSALMDDPGIADSYAATAPLGGRDGLLDSYGMIRFLVEVDFLLSEATGKDIVLINDTALAGGSRPFTSLAGMAAYIADYLKDEKHD